jgi:putative phage-type endonuclease
MMNLIQRKNTLIKNSIQALTKEWFKIRENQISGTDIGTIIGVNHHDNTISLLNKKLNPTLKRIDNIYTRHGVKYEPVAISILETMKNIKIEEIGYVVDEEKQYLGATPDGITIYNNELSLIEIKCPLQRTITGMIPMTYYAQMQLQMFVCKIKQSLFFECDFEIISEEEYEQEDDDITKGYNKEAKEYWRLRNYNLVEVKYDPLFLSTYENNIYNFYNTLKNTRKRKNSRKRSREDTCDYRNDSIQIRKKDVKYNKYTYTNFNKDDKCNAWLSLFGEDHFEPKDSTLFQKEIKNKMGEGMKRTFDYLKKLCNDNNLTYISLPDYNEYQDYNLQKTKQYINEKYDIIFGPHLYDGINNVYSIPDSIISNSALRKLYPEMDMVNTEYYVMNFSRKKVYMINGGKKISNNMDTIKLRYNNELDSYVLNKTLNKDGEYSSSLLLFDKWFYKVKNKKINMRDNRLYSFTHDSVEIDMLMEDMNTWMDEIKVNGKSPRILYENEEYLPTTFNDRWSDIKKDILKSRKDIQLMYNIGSCKAKILRNKYNITKWNDDNFKQLLNTRTLTTEIKLTEKDTQLMEKMIDFNTQSKYKKDIIYPSKNTKVDLPNNKLEFYVDFETINDFIGPLNMIYLVGVFVKLPNNKTEFKYFMTKDLTRESEKVILKEWIDYTSKLERQYNTTSNIYSWSNAENNFLKIYNDNVDTKDKVEVKFIDLKECIKNNHILLKGNIENFGIKTITKYMNKYNLIDSSYEELDNCDNGADSIIHAINYYKTGDKKLFSELIQYNKLDCKLMYDILVFFRDYFP